MHFRWTTRLSQPQGNFSYTYSEVTRAFSRSICISTSAKTPSHRIRKVTVAGVTGAIGPSIIKALAQAGFEVQALTRSIKHQPKLDVGLRKVDYRNNTELVTILKGQDAVISCLGDTAAAVSAQSALINASINAGVKRFLPSEFGSDTSNYYVRSLPFFHHKVEHQDLLERAAAAHESSFSYTILITGLFLDWCLSVVPCIINVAGRNAQVFDNGDIPFSVTRTATVANAVVNILKQPIETRNRCLRIHEAVVTQKELVQRAERLTQARFNLQHIDTADYEHRAWRAYRTPHVNRLDWIVPFVNLSIWSSNHPGHFRDTNGPSLGVKELRGVERERMIEFELRAASDKMSKLSLEIQNGLQATKSMASVANEAYKAGLDRFIGV